MKRGFAKNPDAVLHSRNISPTPHSACFGETFRSLRASGTCPPRGMPRSFASRRNEQGVALIIVLLMISIIVAVTIQLNRSTRSEVYDAANLSDGIQMRYVAESAFYAGEALLLADKNLDRFTALTQDWAKTDMLALKSEEFFDHGSFNLLIEDEGGKIPVNLLAGGNESTVRNLMMNLLTGPYFRLPLDRAREIVDAIKDWIDVDNEITGSGAEGGYYEGLEKPYPAKNDSLDCIEELLMVKGVTRELFYGTGETFGLIQCLTVFDERAVKVNINTAPKPVLRALSDKMTDDAVERIEEDRRNEKTALSSRTWYTQVHETADLNIPADLIVVQSGTFRITAVGLQGRMAQRITAVVRRETGQKTAKLLSWKVD